MKKMIWYVDNKTDNYENKNNNNNINRKFNLNKVNNKDYERPFLLNYIFKIDNGTKDTNKRKIIYGKWISKNKEIIINIREVRLKVIYAWNGNYYNQCYKAIIKNPVIIKQAG